MRCGVEKLRLAVANEFTPHCSAMAGAVGVILMILVFAFFFIPMLIIMINPNPLLIKDYESAASKAAPLIVGLMISGAVAYICAKL
jgi:hypothetical protein